MENGETKSGFQCSNCESELPPGDGQREVTCAYCSTAQPHPRPYPVGQEVMVPNTLTPYALGVVRSCDGPDGVEVEVGKSRTRYAVESLVPVVNRAAEVEEGARVFARNMHGWELTWVVSCDRLNAVVKHADKSFQSSFFDRSLAIADVRLPARAADRAKKDRSVQRVLGKLTRVVKIVVIIGIALVALAIAAMFVVPLVLG
jgi:hypothetical protein